MDVRIQPPRQRLMIAACYFGFSSAIAQVLLIRELLALFRGNEFIIGIIYAGWFLGIFAGASLNPEADDRTLDRRIDRSIILLPVLLLISLLLIICTPILMPRTTGTYYTITEACLLSVAFTAPVGFPVGYFFPPLVALMSSSWKEKSGGIVYVVESAGGFAGGALFSFLLIDTMGPIAVASLLMMPALLLVIRINSRKALYASLAVPLLLFLLSDTVERSLLSSVWERTRTGKLMEHRRTKYQTIDIAEAEGQASIYGDGVLYCTLPDHYESRPLFHLIQSVRPDGNGPVLLFGVGPGSIPHNLAKTGIKTLRYIEIDPGLWEAVGPYRRQYYPGLSESMSVTLMDMRTFLVGTDEKFDMIVCLPPMPHNAMLNRFFTEDFYRLSAGRLSEKGIFMTRIAGFGSALESEQKLFTASVYKSFCNIFPYRLLTSGDAIYLIGARGKNVLPRDPEILISRYEKRFGNMQLAGLEKEIVDNFSSFELRGLFERTHLAYFLNAMAPLLPAARENRDDRPLAFWNYIIFTSLQEQTALYVVLKNFWVLIIAALFISAAALFRLKRRHGADQCAGGFFIFVIGLVSMSTVVLLIMLYQNYYGIVYYRISLISAMFMLGLAAGSLAANKLPVRSPGWAILLLVLAMGSIFLFMSDRSEWIFWIILILFATLCGTAFPTIYRTISMERHLTTASNLDSMDFLGSIIGSIIPALILPSLGAAALLLCNMALLLTALILSLQQGICRRNNKETPIEQ